MAIRLTRITPRTGDKGTTALVGGVRVPKKVAASSPTARSTAQLRRRNRQTFLRVFIKFGNDGEWYSEMLRRIPERSCST